MRKLGLSNVGELTLVAYERGLIERPGTVARLFGKNQGDIVEVDRSKYETLEDRAHKEAAEINVGNTGIIPSANQDR